MKAHALVHDVYYKYDMNAMFRLGAIATVRTWSKCLGSSKEGLIIPVLGWLGGLGELKRGIDHPCFGMTWGTLKTTFGPMATMLCGFIFEGLTTYAPIHDLIAVVGGLWSNRNHLSTLVPIIWMEWHCAFLAQFHTVECRHKTNAMLCLGSIATVEMDRH